METWSAHHLYSEAARSLGDDKAASLRNYAQQLMARDVAVVFSLRHLAKIAGVNYRMLHETVNRKREAANYRMYAVKKRTGGRRFIHSPSEDLFRVQQFINQEILQKVAPHPASFAFHNSGGIRRCAGLHCGAKWLFQFDLKDFFYDVTEIDAYRVFQDLGYRNLIAFELARICTTTHLPHGIAGLLVRKSELKSVDIIDRSLDPTEPTMPYPMGRSTAVVGVLPQGAPTSPMLSNLAARKLDELLTALAFESGMTYTRYADDITISATRLSSSSSIGEFHRKVVQKIRAAGFTENREKTRIAGPGSRKVVLGLLVDGDTPRLSRAAYSRIDRHLHASLKFGLPETATHEGFDSAFGFYNHLSGLIAYVKDVDRPRWELFAARLKEVAKPWQDGDSFVERN